MAKPKNTSHSGAGQLRIIGGEWRSRKLDFPHVEGLRPTPDRVRETLFNWLAPHIGGARVLDVFAGSGALFLEAMSRGAAKGVALDSNRDAISNIRENMGILRCTVGEVQQTDALRYLDATPSETFAVVPNGDLISSYANARWSDPTPVLRSEERRVGKECRSRWSPYH